MPNFTKIWDVTPETAHPRAKALLGQSIIWDYGDEDSPLGNDTGADAFAAYLNFRATQSCDRVEAFIHNQLLAHGFSDSNWDVIEIAVLQKLLGGGDGARFLRRDDFIIALAFSQLVLDGTVGPRVRRRAVAALRRQEMDVVILHRGGGGVGARKKQLAEFRRILGFFTDYSG